eukprot:201449-Chlamydomonas_euryale.AAC.3
MAACPRTPDHGRSRGARGEGCPARPPTKLSLLYLQFMRLTFQHGHAANHVGVRKRTARLLCALAQAPK